MLAACGGKNTDDYVGVWQRDNAKFLQFVEIKKDGGNYLFSQEKQNYTFSEKNGELVLNTGLGEKRLWLPEKIQVVIGVF